MDNEQSWKTCEYGFASDGGDEMSYELKNHGLFEGYNCGNRNILSLRIYPQRPILEKDGSILEVALLHGILIDDELDKDSAARLQKGADRALAGCRHCKYYKQK